MKGHHEYVWSGLGSLRPFRAIVVDEDDGDSLVVIPISSRRVAIYDTDGAKKEYCMTSASGRRVCVPICFAEHLVTVGSHGFDDNLRRIVGKLSGMVTS